VAFHWRGQIRTYDNAGEMIGGIDGRGVTVPDTNSTNVPPGVTANGSAATYTHSSTFNYLGDRTSSSTPPIATTKGGTTSTGPATNCARRTDIWCASWACATMPARPTCTR